MKLKKIATERRRLADDVYAQLLNAIRSNEIKADDRLVQERLATELQISRTPVREALLRLEQEGILETSPRGGFVIRHMTHQEVEELYQARTAIEVQAARILANQNNPAKNAQLREIVEHEENIVSNTTEAYFRANRNVHRAIVELSENRYLLELFDNIWNRGISFELFAAIGKIDLSKSLGDHITLVEAIETGNPDKVVKAVIDHIHEGLDLQIEALDS
ncbi:MAG: GntR family transcriptional regulator [Gammaproteobacteria bacterium]|nr:GntR family transcriptional regulator [Gammaproteobacteria bacterium]